MAVLIGISAGETKRASAGATRRIVTLTVSADGTEAIIGDRRVTLRDNMLVYWHQSDAGTWHGLATPEELRTVRATDATAWTDRAIIATSTSGGADIAAVVVAIPPGGLVVVTSGYDGRSGWTYQIVRDGTVEKITPAEYRAQFAAAESL